MSVQNLKLRVIAKFPASVTVGSGLTLTNTNGAYSITLDSDLSQIAALSLGPDQSIYWPSLGVPGAYPLTSIGRAIAGSSSAPSKSVLIGGNGTPSFSTTPTVAGLTVNANAGTIPLPPANTVVQVAGADGASAFSTYDGFGSASFSVGAQFRKARNTAAAPQALGTDDPIGGIYAFGYGATAYSTSQRGFAGFFAGENWSDTNQGSYFSIYTTATGGSTSAEKVRVGPDGMVTLTGTGGLVNGSATKLSIGGLSSASEILGTTQATASFAVGLFDATASDAPQFNFYRSKNAAIGSATVVASGDALGKITWYGAQQTGTFATQNPAAQVRAEVDATVTSGASGDMPGRIVLATTADGSGTLTDRLTISSTGLATFANRVTINDILTTAGQIAFPATQLASSDPNTLDDYEEGTWTPVLTFSTPGNLAVVYSAQFGSYTKIGRQVVLQCLAQASSFTWTTSSGTFQITGLPFASANTTNQNFYASPTWQGITKAGFTQITATIAVNTSILTFQANASGSGIASVVTTDVPSAGTPAIGLTIPYFTA